MAAKRHLFFTFSNRPQMVFGVKVGSTVQNSGTTANNFSESVVYTVIASNSTTREYIARVTIAALTSPIPDTGQTFCYNATSTSIACPAEGASFYGQDANYIINAPSYADNGNDTITDNVTGLVLQKTEGGQMTWTNAGAYCDNLTLGGQSDWRLPAIRELVSILDLEGYNPTIDTTYFPSANSANYWASSNGAGIYTTSYSWVMSFNNGHSGFNTKTNNYYVRCVRGEEQGTSDFIDNGDGTATDASTGLTWQQNDDDNMYSWQNALAHCESLVLAGQSNWRLPNPKELLSIADYDTHSPAIDTALFFVPNAPEYWVSTTYGGNFEGAYYVNFNFGSLDFVNKGAMRYFRCVRGGL